MRINDYLGSLFESLPAPDESYREFSFSCQKWHFETVSQDVKWFLIRREFVTLSEQAMEWIDRFDVPETIKLDAKRLIWNVKYVDYKKYRMSSPTVIALCALKIVYDLKKMNFFTNYKSYMETVRNNTTRTSNNSPRFMGNRTSDYSSMEKIKYKAEQLREAIGKEAIDDLKRMWGCMDEASILA